MDENKHKCIVIKNKRIKDSLFIKKPHKRIKRNCIDNEISYNDELLLLKKKDKKTIKTLQIKLSGYLQQDIKKNRTSTDNITMEQLLNKLVESDLKCIFCKKHVKIHYRQVRDSMQWTLDRIDNDLAHTELNTKICCLRCNISRRRMDDKRFKRGKQLKFVKSILT